MGGIYSRRSAEDDFDEFNFGPGFIYQPRGLPAQQMNADSTPEVPISYPEVNAGSYASDDDDGIPGLASNKSRLAKSNITKVSQVTRLGKAGTAGLEKAVEVLDTLGSSLTNLGPTFEFGVATKDNKITILSFEVANTIVKGASLMQSLSKDNIKHLKEVVLPSEGVQHLISEDMDELLRIASSDKREELKVLCGEVVRFGNRCEDPQWHNLDRYFERLGSELIPQEQLKQETEASMEHLVNLVQYTAELYHELHVLDRFEKENFNAPPRGDSLAIMRAELKSQRKLVRSLQKKSLWSKLLDEVMEQLVDIVHFLQMEIHNAFGTAVKDHVPSQMEIHNALRTAGRSWDTQTPVKSIREKLGAAGLALHYANIITQINTLVTRCGFVPPSARDSLYQGLPPNIKSAMHSNLYLFHPKEEFTIPEIKAEMEKTLQWLVPIATNTSKAYHGFGWVGEWANTGFETNGKPVDPLRIETLHHADKEKTDEFILKLVVLLHHLVCQSKAINSEMRLPVKFPFRSPNQKQTRPDYPLPTLTTEDQELLQDVSKRKPTPESAKV